MMDGVNVCGEAHEHDTIEMVAVASKYELRRKGEGLPYRDLA
jgi:hypothetical protein